ncbi:MAG: S41 family peptidase [Patescibacteria group bacterium]|nr:S41 family peptidase [Patescibacteria group bacterium]
MKENKKVKIWVKIISAALLLFFVFIVGYVVGVREGKDFLPPDNIKNANNGSEVDFSLFWQAWNKARELYIGQSVPQEMIYGAISGMVASLGDPYTVFLKPSDNEKLAADLSGEFEGIGAELTIKNDVIVVVSPLSGTPSEKAGLKAKDIIIKIDDESTEDMSLNQAVDKIRGEAGTTVKLTIIRTKIDEPVEISIVRENIEVPSVTLNTEIIEGKKIAILKIIQFGDDTVQLATKYAQEISNSDIDGIVLDLRNDPGGYLDSSVRISGLFIEKGSVAVIEIDKEGEKKEYKTDNEPILKDYQIVTLVNGGTASAAEIVAGALYDHGRTNIIGEKTFGKGSVQALEPLIFGSSLKVTIAKWLTPKGSEIDGVGIKPDFEIKNENSDTDLQLEKAKGVLLEKINR